MKIFEGNFTISKTQNGKTCYYCTGKLKHEPDFKITILNDTKAIFDLAVDGDINAWETGTVSLKKINPNCYEITTEYNETVTFETLSDNNYKIIWREQNED